MLDLGTPESRKRLKWRELAERELGRWKRLSATRSSIFDPAWQTLSDYFLPNISDINTDKTEGITGWSDRLFDVTGIEDARTCTTGQSNWATPATEPWFAWSPPKFMNSNDDDDNAIWCAICTDIALEELARSNYYPMSGIQYKSRTVFGTGQLHIEQTKNSLLSCSTRKVGTYSLDKNSEGLVDTIYAEFKLTARAAAQKFPDADLGDKITKALKDNGGKGMDQEFLFVHVIRPREEIERDPGRIDGEHKPIASIYLAVDDRIVVENGGYEEMPDSVTRFDDWGTGTPYGYSPAFETLPNARQLNYMVRFSDAQVELRANPRMIIPVGLAGQVDLRPGGQTIYDPSLPGAGKPEEWMTQADVQGTQLSIEGKQKAMGRMFYTDVFRMLSELEGKRTAFEIRERLGEKLEQLSPMFGRIINEKTTVDLKRVFGLCFRAGKFPQPPRSMYVPDPTGRKLRLAMPDVTYTSRLALALKSMQNKATVNTLQFVSEFAKNTGRLDVLDNFDIDGAVRDFSINEGMSARYLRPFKNVVSLRDARAKQQQQDRALQMASEAATAAGKLGKAPQAVQDSVTEQLPAAS